MLLLLIFLRLLISFQIVWLFKGNVLKILRDGDINRFERFLEVDFNHVNIFTSLILEHLVYLEQVHLDTSLATASRLSLKLFLSALLGSELGALVHKFDQEHHPHAVKHKSVVHCLLKVCILVECEKLLSGKYPRCVWLLLSELLLEEVLLLLSRHGTGAPASPFHCEHSSIPLHL